MYYYYTLQSWILHKVWEFTTSVNFQVFYDQNCAILELYSILNAVCFLPDKGEQFFEYQIWMQPLLLPYKVNSVLDDVEFNNLCIKQEWDPNLAQEYYDIISKIFNDAMQEDTEFNKKLVDRQNEFHRTALLNYKNWMDLSEKIRKNIEVENGEIDLILLIRYFITVESLASHYATILYYACHKAYCDNTGNHYESFNTVHNHITLGRRLNLIKKHGLKKYANNIDNMIRNSVGHMTFKINNGKIKIPTDKTEMHDYTEINIEQVGSDLDKHIRAMYAAVWRYYQRYSKNQVHTYDWPTYL